MQTELFFYFMPFGISFAGKKEINQQNKYKRQHEEKRKYCVKEIKETNDGPRREKKALYLWWSVKANVLYL